MLTKQTYPLIFAGPEVEYRSQPPQSMAERQNRLPSGRCSNEAAVADRLDEQLHETCGCIVSHCISPSALARRLSLVPGGIHTNMKAFLNSIG